MYAKESASGFTSWGAWEADVASPARLEFDEKDATNGGDEEDESWTDALSKKLVSLRSWGGSFGRSERELRYRDNREDVDFGGDDDSGFTLPLGDGCVLGSFSNSTLGTSEVY